jgi:hypothetical protein
MHHTLPQVLLAGVAQYVLVGNLLSGPEMLTHAATHEPAAALT